MLAFSQYQDLAKYVCVFSHSRRSISLIASNQQHGSVYWSASAESLLANLDSEKSLLAQLCPNAFSIAQSPIWQDSSTTEECALLNSVVGGEQALADLTGSRAYERFTGPQIARVKCMINF